MLVRGQQWGFIRKMALWGDEFTPNAYLRVGYGPNGPRLQAHTFMEIDKPREMFLQRSRSPHEGSP